MTSNPNRKRDSLLLRSMSGGRELEVHQESVSPHTLSKYERP